MPTEHDPRLEAALDPIEQPLASRRNHWVTWVARHARMTPERVAFRFLGVDTTWAQLHERVHRLAGALERRGVQRGDRVALLTLNRTEFFEAVLATNALGAIAVPVNFRLTPPEVAFIVRDCGARAVFTETALAPLVAAVRAEVPELSLVVRMGPANPADPSSDVLAYDDLVAEDTQAAVRDLPEDTVALILYTSGTTGHPKGAMLSHGNLAAQSLTCIRAFASHPDDIAMMAAPSFHVAALGAVAPNLQLGIRTVIHPLREFSPTDVLEAWERERVTTVFLVPAQWQAVCAEPSAPTRDLALRCISWGAAPASDSLLRRMSEVFPDARNVAVFGQTEMSPITCVLDGEDALRKLGSVGRVVPTVEAMVVDPVMDPVPVGEVGEIVYRGPTLMQGYWGNPEATREAFAGGWFHSGDLVRQDDEGFVWVVDRTKDMIISGGENIYCAEVENAIAEHPDVVEVAVVGRPDERWGEVAVATLSLRPGASPMTSEELRGFLTGRLAAYKHPTDVHVVEALPRNASGKVVKAQLRQRHAAG